MGSQIRVARGNLYDLLVARPGLQQVQVTYGPPDAAEEHEVVSLGPTESPSEEPQALATTQPRDEDFVLVVYVKAHDPTADDGETVDARCWELVEEVRDTVADNPSGIVPAAALRGRPYVISTTSTDGPVPFVYEDTNGAVRRQGWACIAEVRIFCQARITA